MKNSPTTIDSRDHFNQIAAKYDHWKQKNSYYQEELQLLFKSLVRPNSRVLEIGCGTGQVIGSLNVTFGKGIDISEGMIAVAKNNYTDQPNLEFTTENILDHQEQLDYDFIIIPDVIGHIENLPNFIGHIAKLAKPKTIIIISTANHRWQPILHLAESLRLKTPEGPHWWLNEKANESIFRRAGLKITSHGYRFLIPKKIPGADWLNRVFTKSRLLTPLGLGVWWVLEK